MKFGIREICDVVLKAKANITVGNKEFAEGAPVIYFDSLKTSTLEGAATTVYAQGGKGNSRLIAWEGERTVTFTMEDALISEMGLAVLTGAGLIEADDDAVIYQHIAERIVADTSGTVKLSYTPSDKGDVYLMELDKYDSIVSTTEATPSGKEITGTKDKVYLVDYYTERTSGAKQIEITPDKFGGNFYLEASTLFRNTDGVDMPAEFIIPNCKIQSNFTFSMASSGDPSTFTFTMDAFPDYTKFDKTKKVLSVIQIIEEDDEPKTTTNTEE